MKPKRRFTIAAVYDTETTTIGDAPETIHAFPILFIDNDIRGIDLREYTPERDDYINLYRYEEEYLAQIREYVAWGQLEKQVPVICAYNLMFDLQPLMESLSKEYDIEVNAQSSTNVYTLDLYAKDTSIMLLRFWDTFHLDMRGLEKMGEVAGLPKATGSWDYSLIRTPETPLTDEEVYYARRDTQVIPAFLKFLLRTNDWMKPEDLGNRVLTKTSLVRQMARNEIGPLKVKRENGKEMTLQKMFLEMCKQEQPRTYNSYAIRKACFRGGFTFTGAAYASNIQENVVSVDVTSMHHTFINGRFIPVGFKYDDNEMLRKMCENVLATPKSYVLENYHCPFRWAFHARIKLTNIRMRRCSAFELHGIALEPLSKFTTKAYTNEDASKYASEQALIDSGFNDKFTNGLFAFGKLYEADEIIIHVNEVELWTMSRVYEWDSLEVIWGEGSMNFVRPPDYVTLQSNMLYRLKDDNKFITNHYKEGQPYPYHIPEQLPESFAHGLRDGTQSWDEFNAYYISDTKGKFNGIYGTMAQDTLKPQYECRNGVIQVDQSSVVNHKNFEEKNEDSKILYTYGMRIVGGSRLHMVLAIEELSERLHGRIRVLGGDTDSMKISCDEDVTDKEISEALDVFERISKSAIDVTMERVRKNHPKLASSLRGIGGFEIENEGNHYVKHIELWNKCRCSISKDKHVHITCAGLSRPHDQYHIERFMQDLCRQGYEEEDVLKLCVGFNVFVSHAVCHALEGKRPQCTDIFRGTVRDYQGRAYDVFAHESVALYSAGRWLGETLKQQNRMTVNYLERRYGRVIDTRNRYLFYDGTMAELCTDGASGYETLMLAEVR